MRTPAPLRVLVVGLNYAPERTGIAPYTTGMARGLAQAGHQVHVMAGYPYYPQWRVADGYRGLRREERDGPVTVTRLRHYVPGDSTGIGRVVHEASFAAHTLARAPRRVDVVIAVSPSLLSAAAAARTAARANAPLGIVVQDLYSAAITEVGALGGRGRPGVARLESSLLRRAAGVAVIHDRFRDNLVNTLGVDKALVSVIRNWVHIGAASSRDRLAARKALGWPQEELLVVHAGNMGAKQDLRNVADAARIADQRKAPVRFVLIGDGSRRRELERHAVGVERLAVLDPLPAGVFEVALTAADVLLVNERPGVRSLCVPSKLTSYFAAGRPVVAACAADGITAEELRASGGGVWVPPGRPEALLDTVLAVAADRRYGAHLGAAGRRYASTRLSATKAVVDYQRWVAGLVAGRC